MSFLTQKGLLWLLKRNYRKQYHHSIGRADILVACYPKKKQIRWRLFGKSISLSMAITLLGKQ